MIEAHTDPDAIKIGELYETAQGSAVDQRIFYYAEAGNLLLRKKESLGHGLWQRWLYAQQGALGFSDRSAHKLIAGAQWLAANWHLANELEEIITNPHASAEELAKANEIRQLIAGQMRPIFRGTLGRRRNDWFTPRQYIQMARVVLGDIDVDPASNEDAQQTVRAHEYFDKERNGLCQPWHGRVFLNPPYSKELIGKFISKLLMEWDSKRMTAGIMLTHNFTDTGWFQDAAAVAESICFTQGRIKYYGTRGEFATPTQGQAFFYFGSDVETFKQTFGRVGLIVTPQPDSWSRRRIREVVHG